MDRVRQFGSNKTFCAYSTPVAASTFNFKRQTTQYEEINDILARYHMQLDLVGYEFMYPATKGAWDSVDTTKKKCRMRFVAFAGDQSQALFVWHKYEGTTQGSGQNHVYVGGVEIRTSSFLRMSESKLDELFNKVLLQAFVTQ